MGIESIMVNSNPETVSTDYDTSDKLYFEPLTVEDVLSIYQKEKPKGVIVQFGGQTPLNIAGELADAGVRILGTHPDKIDLAEDRDRFRQIMRELGIPQPESGMAADLDQAREIAAAIGYPLMVRPSYVLGGRGMEVVQDEEMLEQYLTAAVALSPERPVLIDKFLDNAIEAEADAIADGSDAFVPAVMEHIELAGIHSGDSACVIPPISIPPKHIETIREYTRSIAKAFAVVGLLNVQYAIFENTVYVLEANPRASRTVPIVSKVCGIAMARLAAEVMLGKTIPALQLTDRTIPHYGVKEAVFPFNMFPEVDPVLGPEMRSTGEVLGLSHSYGRAFFKAQEATQVTLPLQGTVLFTIADRDKTAALEPVRLFRDLGFRLLTTRGTHEFLLKNGIETEAVHKIGYGRPDLVDAIKNGDIQLLVNTPSGRRSSRDSSEVRKAAIKYRIPYITTTAAAIAAARGIAARREGVPKVRSLQKYHAALEGRRR
jgi:carbamoyl-phosphate synthase large subunit